MRHITLTLLLAFAPAAMAAKKPDALKTVDEVMAQYRKAPAVKAKVKKTVKQETMGTETTSDGQFYFSKGKLRLEFTEPDHTTLVFDGKHVWFESRFDETTVQVTKMKSNELKRSRSVLTALFEKKNILRGFKVVKNEGGKTRRTFAFEPKKKSDENEVQHLEIVVNKKDLEKITYRDQLENTITFEFTDLTRGKVPASKFSYKPPKNAEVTEI